jgi:hypothetical protein
MHRVSKCGGTGTAHIKYNVYEIPKSITKGTIINHTKTQQLFHIQHTRHSQLTTKLKEIDPNANKEKVVKKINSLRSCLERN